MTDDSQEFARLLKDAHGALKGTAPSGPRPGRWIAAALGFVQPGLGQFYAGDWPRALCWSAGRWVLFGLLVAMIWVAATPSDRVNALWFALAACVFYKIASGLVAQKLTGDARWSPRPWFSRPIGLAALSLLVLAFDAAAAGVALRWLPLQAYRMSGSSMMPTLREGDQLFTSRIPSSFVPRRGSLVFYHPPDSSAVFAGRVVALGGDEVSMRDGRALVNGRRERTRVVLANASDEQRRGTDGDAPLAESESEVPLDHVFILGDNRSSSKDSRAFGAVPVANIVGRPAWWLLRHDEAGKIDWSAVGESVGP
jgi:signal peptidase I